VLIAERPDYADEGVRLVGETNALLLGLRQELLRQLLVHFATESSVSVMVDPSRQAQLGVAKGQIHPLTPPDIGVSTGRSKRLPIAERGCCGL